MSAAESDEDEIQTKKLKGDNIEEQPQNSKLNITPLKRQLKFESELSPKRMLKNLKESEGQPTLSDTSAGNEKVEEKELISDLKAFEADQERSEERGRKLMQAFEDD